MDILEYKSCLRIIKESRENKEFIDLCIPYTPEILIKEITNNFETLDKNTSFAVLYTIEWAIYLIFLGFQNITMITEKYDKKIAIWAKLIEIEYILLDTAIKENQVMKFDVVIGNPPYQSGENSKLYIDIYNRVCDMLKPSIIAFITPFAIAKGFGGKKVGGSKLLNRNLLIFRNQGIKETHFPSIGLDQICYFIVSSQENLDKVELITNNGVVNVSLEEMTRLSVSGNIIATSIASKCFDAGRHYKRKTTTFESYGDIATFGEIFVIEKINTDMSLKGFNVKMKGPYHPTHGKSRIIYNTLGCRGFVDFSKSILTKKNGSIITVLMDTDIEASNLLDVLNNSSLVNFYAAAITGSNRSPFDTFILNFKYIDFTRSWTDDELYEHFNLTQDEIKYIKTTTE
jgi:hypothetical protein